MTVQTIFDDFYKEMAEISKINVNSLASQFTYLKMIMQLVFVYQRLVKSCDQSMINNFGKAVENYRFEKESFGDNAFKSPISYASFLEVFHSLGEIDEDKLVNMGFITKNNWAANYILVK